MMGMKRFKADLPMKEAVMQPEDQGIRNPPAGTSLK